MPFNAAYLTHGEALEVADTLSRAPSNHIEQEDIVGALINALNRIHGLEQQLMAAEKKLGAIKPPPAERPMSKTLQRRLKEATDAAEAFNKRYPIGTSVTYYELIEPLAKPRTTHTRSEAWVMGGHSAMIMVDGISGGVCLDHIRVE